MKWFVSTKWTRVVTHPVVFIGATLAMGGALGACISSISNKNVGYLISDIAARDSDQFMALKTFFGEFGYFPSQLYWWDVNVPVKQKDMRDAYKSLVKSHYAVKDLLPDYLSLFASAAPPLSDNISKPGYPTEDIWYKTFHGATKWPVNSSVGLTSFLTSMGTTGNPPAWIYADACGVNEFSYHAHSQSPDLRRLRLSYMNFAAVNLLEANDFVKAIEDCNKILDDNPSFSGSEVFLYGTIFVYWDVFLKLEAILMQIFLLDLGVIFVIHLVCLVSPVAALVSTTMCVMIVIEVYGICMRFLYFNIFMASILLAAAGIAVEDVAHSISHFISSHGSPTHRISGAMCATFPAIIQGSMSTMLSILPMAFHPIPFYLKYFFFPFMMVCVCGLLNGLFFTPTSLMLLAFLTRPCTGSGKSTSEISV